MRMREAMMVKMRHTYQFKKMWYCCTISKGYAQQEASDCMLLLQQWSTKEKKNSVSQVFSFLPKKLERWLKYTPAMIPLVLLCLRREDL